MDKTYDSTGVTYYEPLTKKPAKNKAVRQLPTVFGRFESNDRLYVMVVAHLPGNKTVTITRRKRNSWLLRVLGMRKKYSYEYMEDKQ